MISKNIAILLAVFSIAGCAVAPELVNSTNSAPSEANHPKPLINNTSILSIDKCKFDYNLTIDEFEKLFSLKSKPIKMYTDSNRPTSISDQVLMRINKSYFHFKEYGIWVFFTMDGKFKSMRFEAPFSGTVGNVKIGDSLSNVIQIKGNPISNDSNGVLYRSNGYFVNYHTFRNNIFRVFTNRCD